MPEPATAAGSVHGPGEWALREKRGGGPFTTRVTWDVPEGGTATWASRAARKRGEIVLRDAKGALLATVRAEFGTARRLRRLNWIASVAFTIGGSLFALGAWLSQVGSASGSVISSVYFVGGIFFSTGGYASLLQAINAPRRIAGRGGTLAAEQWRWWSYEPMRLDWLATFVLFAGTLAFGVSLLDAFMQGLSLHQENRLIWAPEVIGCVLFLISGHLSMVEVCHGPPCWRSRDLGWWIVAVNQLGSILFFISAMADFTRPETSGPVNLAIANWGTFAGAACFAVGGVIQAFERPSASPD
jgi:hypothetical protein